MALRKVQGGVKNLSLNAQGYCLHFCLLGPRGDPDFIVVARAQRGLVPSSRKEASTTGSQTGSHPQVLHCARRRCLWCCYSAGSSRRCT